MRACFHAQTHAIVLTSLLEVRKEVKRAKLLQCAERMWGISAAVKEILTLSV